MKRPRAVTAREPAPGATRGQGQQHDRQAQAALAGACHHTGHLDLVRAFWYPLHSRHGV